MQTKAATLALNWNCTLLKAYFAFVFAGFFYLYFA